MIVLYLWSALGFFLLYKSVLLNEEDRPGEGVAAHMIVDDPGNIFDSRVWCPVLEHSR